MLDSAGAPSGVKLQLPGDDGEVNQVEASLTGERMASGVPPPVYLGRKVVCFVQFRLGLYLQSRQSKRVMAKFMILMGVCVGRCWRFEARRASCQPGQWGFDHS